MRGTLVRIGADIDRSSGHREDTDYRIVQARAAAERRVGAARVSADAAIGARQFGAADFYSPYPSHETTRSSTATMRATAPATERVTLIGALHTRRHSDVFTLKREDPAFYQNVDHSWQHGGEAMAQIALASRLHAAVGAELLDDGCEARVSATAPSDDTPVRRSDPRPRRERLARRGAAPRLVVGGRIVRVALGRCRGAASGGRAAACVWPAVGSERRRGRSATTGIRRTWPTRRSSVERFGAYEVGLRLAPLARVSADVALFERRAHSLIDWARSATAVAPLPPWRTMNFASATYRGVEALVRISDVIGADWIVRGSGLRFDASAEPGTIGKYALRPLTRVVGVSATTHELRGASFTVDAQRARRAFEDDHLRLDVRLEQRVGRFACRPSCST